MKLTSFKGENGLIGGKHMIKLVSLPCIGIVVFKTTLKKQAGGLLFNVQT